MKKKFRRDKKFNENQASFFFEDFLETNKKNKFSQRKNFFHDRIYLLFFLFFSLILIFGIRIIQVSLYKMEIYGQANSYSNYSLSRRDIVDRNGIVISRNIKSYHAAINPKLIKNKDNFLINLRLGFPDLDIKDIHKKFNAGKYFYLKKRISQDEKEKLWRLGEKGVIFEPFQSRIYTHANLFSHIIGQVDYDNYGVSGLEKYLDRELKDNNLAKQPLELTLDTNIQYLINKELSKALDTFNATGGASLLMDVTNGEILSLASLPNFDINSRNTFMDTKYINKITKGVYELGSIFKTFTIALALDKNLVTPDTIIKNIPRSVKCARHEISDIKQFPKDLSVEDILIRSSNIGTLTIAKKIGEKRLKDFIQKSNLLKSPDLQLEEVGTPHKFDWNKCKLETVSFGHGITTTPLQAVTVYAALANGGLLVKPTLVKSKTKKNNKRLIQKKTSDNIIAILRKVVTDAEGTASLADIEGYYVGGKTGTSQNYQNENKNLNTFISIFPIQKPKYALLVMLEDPQVANELTYNYRGIKIKGSRNEAGWNSVYVAGKIIKKIGPILAIKNDDFNNQYVAEKFN